MNCFCRPQLHVISVTVTPTLVTLTTDKLLTTIGDNHCGRLCVDLAQIPAGSTAPISITDGTLTLTVLRCDGNVLRADSLRRFLCRNARGCCPSFDLSVFRGIDPAHLTVFNRMCPSAAIVAAAGA